MIDLRRRIRWLGLATVLGFGALLARAGQIQLGGSDALAAAALDNALRTVRLEPARGRVLAADGSPLADRRPAVDLVVHPTEIDDADALVATLEPFLDADGFARLAEAVNARGLARHRPWVVLRDVDEAVQARLAGLRHKLVGAELAASERRTYPFGAEAPHLVGYLAEVSTADLDRLDPDRYRSGDLTGRMGLEATLESYLRGVPGTTWHVVDALGREVDGSGAWRSRLDARIAEARQPAVPGAEVRLTVDRVVQSAAVAGLGEHSGAAVMLDVHTGAVLAYASTPGFDPDALAGGVARAEWRALGEDPRKPLLDRVIRGLYPPASTFKIVTTLAALEAGVAPSRTVACNGGATIGGHRFRCWKHGGHGLVDMRRALEQSCDTWFYEVSRVLSPEAIARAGRQLGLGAPTGFAPTREKAGLLPDPEWMQERWRRRWSLGDTVSASIGQGVNLVTPLQLAVMAATVANGGQRVQPWVVDRIVDADGATLFAGGGHAVDAGIDPRHLQVVRDGMRAVVETGTAKRSRIEGLPFAGKTGTAQTVSAGLRAERGGRETEDHALFVAYAPADDPRVALAVVVEHVGGGSAFAAPVARGMLQAWGVEQGLLPDPDAVVVVDDDGSGE